MYEKSKNKIFVSETTLPEAIRRSWGGRGVFEFKKDIRIGRDQLKEVVEIFKNKIARESALLAKKAKSNVDSLESGILYVNLDDRLWLKAAHIVEVFRHYSISKNSARLDTFSLQKKIYKSLIEKDFLTFSIAWGQAKRSCGGLKTEGYFADFSEFYSISVLQVIMKSISLLSGRRVVLKVLTGGERFSEALFTDPEMNREYDLQRTRISEFLGDDDSKVVFQSYRKNIGFDKRSFFNEVNNVSNEDVDKNFKTILVNIDWRFLLRKGGDNIGGIEFPNNLKLFIMNGGSLDFIVKMAVVSIIKKESQSLWIKQLGDVDLFDDIIDFFEAVTKESAKNYLAIQLMSKSERKASKDKGKDDSIRLSVHVKDDLNDIPAIYSLGIGGGNRLSQHVCAFVFESSLLFRSVLEIRQVEGVSRAVSCAESGELFDWLSGGNQPLLYAKDEDTDFLRKLSLLALVDM